MTGCLPCDFNDRFDELPLRERRGPGIFGLLGRPEGERVPVGRQDELATALDACIRGMYHPAGDDTP
ncbi:hypothetical protein F4553_001393 [Allocatelliglobosispora scoriae]|uniref:Uncharacterized protein n=1 Tax=Allocatelliglobosispora scoriae TaxID=643052 RepID=A0A841BIC0_9ACTN|nr:hypothetical protein [Allocatelliglobosispora scoriae]MBB5868014.1 hypothetical protein [Allocatelliglobosispora scoriae]